MKKILLITLAIALIAIGYAIRNDWGAFDKSDGITLAMSFVSLIVSGITFWESRNQFNEVNQGYLDVVSSLLTYPGTDQADPGKIVISEVGFVFDLTNIGNLPLFYRVEEFFLIQENYIINELETNHKEFLLFPNQNRRFRLGFAKINPSGKEFRANEINVEAKIRIFYRDVSTGRTKLLDRVIAPDLKIYPQSQEIQETKDVL